MKSVEYLLHNISSKLDSISPTHRALAPQFWFAPHNIGTSRDKYEEAPESSESVSDSSMVTPGAQDQAECENRELTLK